MKILVDYLNPSANPSNSISRNYSQPNAELPKPKNRKLTGAAKNKLTIFTFSNAWKFMEENPNIAKIK